MLRRPRSPTRPRPSPAGRPSPPEAPAPHEPAARTGAARVSAAAITVLPRDAAERIAAGEVIERPASVVKELVENSLDAGARRITVEIEDGGGRLIRVTDDGDGIPAAELGIAFERFATSKIRTADDLRRVQTYGFRGEALPSIGAVARVEVVTRTRADDAASRIMVTGGARSEVTTAAGGYGTSVTVRELFFNTPARRAFQRSPARETAVVVETVQALALAAPAVAFRLVDSGREILWAPAEPFRARARRIVGAALAPYTLEVHAAGRAAETSGLVGTPQTAQRRRSHQWFLVNGRPVRSALLARALGTAFHTLIPDDQHPVAVLALRLPPDVVDVNVHPRKAEVRFVRDGDIFDDVVRAVRGALRGTPLVHVVGATAAEARPPMASPAAPAVGPATASLAGGPADGAGTPHLAEPQPLWMPAGRADGWPEIRLIGQLALTYLVGDAVGDLVLIDQHAAHERILYELVLWRELAPALAALGFATEPFGPSAVRLTAVPAISTSRAPDELLRACLHDLGTDARHAGRDLEERLAIATACHTAVRAGDRLDLEAMAALLRALSLARDPFSCFHGRPTMVRVPRRDLERWFYRRT